MSSPALTGYTLRPVAPNETLPFTVTVANVGQADATQLRDLTAKSDALAYAGGSYPGTGGDCGATLAKGTSCTLALVAHGTTLGRHTQLVALNYYNGSLFSDAVRDVTFDVTEEPFTPAPAAPLPLMPMNGAGLISKVNLVTVTFSDSADDPEVNAIGEDLVTSEWYLTIAKDYGLSAGTHQHVRLPLPSPDLVYDAADVLRVVAAGHLPSHGDGQDLYMFFFTPHTAYLASQAEAGGWHSTVMAGTLRVPYAIIKPSCSGSAGAAFVAAHELIEAATDSGNGDRFDFSQSEVGDLCDGRYTSTAGYVLPTIWSNVAAAAGADPCIPASGAPFFDVGVAPGGPQVIAPGSSLTLTVTGWSTAPVGDWRVGGATTTQVSPEGDGAKSFTVTFPDDLINNGKRLPLTISAAPDAKAGTNASFALVSRDRQGGARGRLQLISVTVGTAR
jgi:hypothetical protein